MTYACSDLHGQYDKYRALLEKLDLTDDDTLYVLGDVIDRGPDGIKILRDMMERPNIIPILGNHELTAALTMPWLLEEVTEKRLESMTEEQIGCLNDWIINGGAPTLDGLNALTPEERADILDYLRDMDVYEEVSVGERDFLLTHAGIRGYSPDKALDDYDVLDFVFGRPNMDGAFTYGRYHIFGHTPTRVIRRRMGVQKSDDIIIYGGQIAIDCACAYEGKLGAVRLDDLETLYV